MPKRTYIDDTLVRADTTVAHDLDNVSGELADLTERLTSQLSEVVCHLERPGDVPEVEADAVRHLLLRLTATAHYLSAEAENVAAIRSKALTEDG